MNEFGLKGSIYDEDYMIHVLNNLPKEYDTIFDGSENNITSSGDDALMIKVIREKWNNRNEKLRVNIMKGEKKKRQTI